LHTLGVRSGYTQSDVTEFARALTGWTLPGDDALEPATNTFRFVPALHEPGARTVLGRSYADGGEQQARAIIHDLVTAPATAQHIARKLARHFVADEPPTELVQRLASTFERTGGDLPNLYRELVGFLADVAGRLAGAQIPFTSMSGFTTDHVLVRAAQADLAVAVLSGQEPPPQRPGTNP